MSVVENLNQERRITFCLYEYWEKIAGEKELPALRDMNRNEIDPFKKNLVLIDLRNGQDQPTFQVIGQDLQEDLEGDLSNMPLSTVPRRTMLSRITDHYLEVLANRVPIAFEAEFVNKDGEKALYRGILLPFSDDGKNINFILGGVRWILEKDVTLDDSKPTIEELMRSIAEGRKGRPKVTDKTPIAAQVIDQSAEQEEVVSDKDNIEEAVAEPSQNEEVIDNLESYSTDENTSIDDIPEELEESAEELSDPSTHSDEMETPTPPTIEELLAADTSNATDEMALEERETSVEADIDEAVETLEQTSDQDTVTNEPGPLDELILDDEVKISEETDEMSDQALSDSEAIEASVEEEISKTTLEDEGNSIDIEASVIPETSSVSIEDNDEELVVSDLEEKSIDHEVAADLDLGSAELDEPEDIAESQAGEFDTNVEEGAADLSERIVSEEETSVDLEADSAETSEDDILDLIEEEAIEGVVASDTDDETFDASIIENEISSSDEVAEDSVNIEDTNEVSDSALELTEKDAELSDISAENPVDMEKDEAEKIEAEDHPTMTGNVFDRIIPIVKPEAKSLTRKDFVPEDVEDEIVLEEENITLDDLSSDDVGQDTLAEVTENEETSGFDDADDTIGEEPLSEPGEDALELEIIDTGTSDNELSLVDQLAEEPETEEFSSEEEFLDTDGRISETEEVPVSHDTSLETETESEEISDPEILSSTEEETEDAVVASDSEAETFDTPTIENAPQALDEVTEEDSEIETLIEPSEILQDEPARDIESDAGEKFDTELESIEPSILEENINVGDDINVISSEAEEPVAPEVSIEDSSEDNSEDTLPSAAELEEINALLATQDEELEENKADSSEVAEEAANETQAAYTDDEDDDLSIEELMQSILSERKFDLAYQREQEAIGKKQEEDQAETETLEDNIISETDEASIDEQEQGEAEIALETIDIVDPILEDESPETDLDKTTSHEDEQHLESEEFVDTQSDPVTPVEDEDVSEAIDLETDDTSYAEPEIENIEAQEVISDEITDPVDAVEEETSVAVADLAQSSDEEPIVSENDLDEAQVEDTTETSEAVDLDILVDGASDQTDDEFLLEEDAPIQEAVETEELKDLQGEDREVILEDETDVVEEDSDAAQEAIELGQETTADIPEEIVAEDPASETVIETAEAIPTEPTPAPERKRKGSVIERAMAMMAPGFSRPKEEPVEPVLVENELSEPGHDGTLETGSIEINEEAESKEASFEEHDISAPEEATFDIADPQSFNTEDTPEEDVVENEADVAAKSELEDETAEGDAEPEVVAESEELETADDLDEPVHSVEEDIDFVDIEDADEALLEPQLEATEEEDILLDPDQTSLEEEIVNELLETHTEDTATDVTSDELLDKVLAIETSEASKTSENEETTDTSDETIDTSFEEDQNEQVTQQEAAPKETNSTLPDENEDEDYETEEEENELSVAELKATLKQVTGYIKKEDANHNRSRDSLYNILTAIYEFHRTCESSPESYDEIVNEAGLKVQSRAPYTPVLKICLGKDYDKTRLTEYAAALGIAKYMDVEVDEFHDFIKNFPGGIKGCVKEMRIIRKHGASGNVMARKTKSVEEARAILRDMAPIASFRLKKVIVGNNVDEFCLLLAKRDGHDINVLKIIDDKFTKLDPIIKRTAFIKGNLNDRK